MKIKNADFLAIETIKLYSEIDPMEVLKQLLLHRGEGVVSKDFLVSKKLLDDMALLVYNLKSNTTNKLYVGLILDKFFQRNDMLKGSKILVPKNIYDECLEINQSFRVKPQKS